MFVNSYVYTFNYCTFNWTVDRIKQNKYDDEFLIQNQSYNIYDIHNMSIDH